MLPNTYKKLQYIESSGGQAISTGVNCTSDITFELKALALDTSSGSFIGATRDARDNRMGVNDGKFYLLWGESGGHTSFDADNNWHVYKLDNGRQYLDGNDIYASGTKYSEIGINLFSRNYQYPTYAKGRMAYCKMYSNGTLIRDFIPALRKSDSVPGMYDLVNDRFYTNIGSGQFTYKLAGNAYIKINGSWKQGMAYVKTNGTWKQGIAKAKVNGAWK